MKQPYKEVFLINFGPYFGASTEEVKVYGRVDEEPGNRQVIKATRIIKFIEEFK